MRMSRLWGAVALLVVLALLPLACGKKGPPKPKPPETSTEAPAVNVPSPERLREGEHHRAAEVTAPTEEIDFHSPAECYIVRVSPKGQSM